MATQSSILAWRISWTEEPGGLQSVGFQRVSSNHFAEELVSKRSCDILGKMKQEITPYLTFLPGQKVKNFTWGLDVCAQTLSRAHSVMSDSLQPHGL